MTDALGVVIGRASERAVTRACILVQNEARRLCPVDQGTLRRSITFRVDSNGTSAVGRVGSNLEYALAVEVGTGIYGPVGRPITPKRSPVLVFPGKNGTVFARSVRGRPATPYLRPALQAARRAG